MRSCMTEHFGSDFVKNLLSSKAQPAPVSPSMCALPTPSHAGGFEAICPKLHPSLLSSPSVHSANKSNLGPISTFSDPSRATVNNTTMPSQDLMSPSSHTRWLMERNIPKDLRRKNLMYKDKLRVLLPKQNPVPSSLPAIIQQQYLPGRKRSSCEYEDLSYSLMDKLPDLDYSTTESDLVANPILSQKN